MHLPFVLRVGDHPRVCGEKGRTGALDVVQRGSPPRMRGKVRELLFSFHCARITPAYAGKSRVGGTILRFNWDHPRVCGEKASFVSSMQNRPGSPPRMRGKVGHCLSVDSRSGITPAYAGKRPKQAVGSFQPRDHPRVCGEKKISEYWLFCRWGSPPRMRGKGLTCSFASVRLRITPAYAGKRQTQKWLEQLMRDHPRVCGEKTKKIP